MKNTIYGINKTAIKKIHFPQTRQELEKAKKSLIFEELFLIQAGLLLLKKQHQVKNKGIKIFYLIVN